MGENYEVEQEPERVILVGVSEQNGDDCADSMEELAELVRTAGAVVVGQVVQNLTHINPATYIGSGKVEEVRTLLAETGADGIVCDDELAPAQMKNLELELDAKVMDRTLLILDIFAQRASTSEGKIQVELAQLKYRQTRLVGMRSELSRLGGGIGTRGPGEKKLEMDRRLIKNRIAQLNRELREVRQNRAVTRSQREKNSVPVAAIVGYTNAGKSTLLNKLTGANVLQEDKLFATLDPTTRSLSLPGKQNVLLTDTVGFIRKLPHHLIDAFRSTLEEAVYADILVHVVDASNPQREKQMYIVYETLQQLGVKDKKIITLFNKQDKVQDMEPAHDFRADKILHISAKEGIGLEEFKETLTEVLRENKKLLDIVLPYAQAGELQAIRKKGELLSEEYLPEGIAVKAFVPEEIYARVTALCNA